MKKKKNPIGQIALNIFFCVLCACYVYPMLLLVSISLEGGAQTHFSIIPKVFSLYAYERALANPTKIINAYAVTAFYSIVATMGSLLVMSLFAYALSKRDFRYRNVITFLLFFTTLFNGGLVPSYLINAKFLHLNNTVWIYIIPSLMSAWNVILLRTFFQGLPEGLSEAARIDGASELRVCFQIILPLATPVLASVGFLTFIGLWNNWSTAQIYIRNPDLYSLQYLLKIFMDGEEELKAMQSAGMVTGVTLNAELRNLESLRFAMAVLAAAPATMLFPFFQKYFAKGLTIGSIKG